VTPLYMKTADELRDSLVQANEVVEVGSTYIHYKNLSHEYTIVDLVIIEATEEVGVVYQAEYDNLKGIKFLRPISVFTEKVTVNGRSVDRFVRIR
jgi:hypothetical protein